MSLFFSLQASFAESWDDFGGLDKAWDGQKSVTNKEFEEAINVFEKKQKEKEAKNPYAVYDRMNKDKNKKPSRTK